MKITLGLLSCCLIAFAGSLARPAQSHETKSAKPEDLTCEISIPSEVKVVDGWVKADLVVKNVSDKPVRISTLVSGSRHVGKGSYRETFSPDWWKSDRPRSEEFFEKIAVLYPHDTFTFPIAIHYEYHVEFFRGVPLTIEAGYSTGKEFAGQYGVWQGDIHAKPVTVTVIE
jgi:hypothetical protein